MILPPALVILAAGESSRMGRCKALLPLTPKTPLELLTSAGAALGGGPPLVITGADHERIAAAAPSDVEVLCNPEWRRGRTGGVLLAARHRPGRDLCIAPVDVPRVPAEVFEALLAAWTDAGAPPRGWLAPAFTPPGEEAPRYGHPIVLGRELAADLDGVGPSTPLNRLRSLARPLFSVAVGTPAILEDLDTPEDFQRFRVP